MPIVMADLKKWIIDNNRVTAPLLSLLFSMIIVMISLVVELAIYAIPVAVFFTFHYTKIFRIRTRVFGSLLVFLLVAILATAIFAQIVYTSSPTVEKTSSDGTTLTASVLPFAGVHDQFNFSVTVSTGTSMNYSSTLLTINTRGSAQNISFNQMKTFVNSNGDTVIYYNEYNLPAGLYYYNFTLHSSNGTMISTGPINGPINSSELTLYTSLLPSFVIEYIIYFELIFGMGLLLGRSLSHSRRFEPPREETKKE